MNLYQVAFPSVIYHSGYDVSMSAFMTPASWPFRLMIWAFALVTGYLAWAWTVRGPPYKPDPGCLEGKNVIITGCNTGIGKLTAELLLECGAKVIFACRNKQKAEDCIAEIKTRRPHLRADKLEFMQLDVCNNKTIVDFAKAWSERPEQDRIIHVLLCNAGVISPKKGVTKDGFDETLASNCLGHFLLIELLMPVLKWSEDKLKSQGDVPRICQVTSALALECHSFDWTNAIRVRTEEERTEFLKKDFARFGDYSQSKFFQMMTTTALARKLKAEGSMIPVNAAHPGEVNTDVTRDFPEAIRFLIKNFEVFVLLFMKTPEQGCKNNVFCCTSKDMKDANSGTGQYMFRLTPVGLAPMWENVSECQRAYDLCCDLLKEWMTPMV
jgi:NAD(P)-dependent dehydrogenase (short-subunit alcohol dehydrogenase family)